MVHAVLEKFVRDVYIDKVTPNGWDFLHAYLQAEIITTYGDLETPYYAEAKEMLQGWFERTDLAGVTVLSVENKLNFELPTSVGPIPFNYIFDRFDQIGPRTFKVVDYKTLRWGFNPEDLKKKTQARVYALAASIWLKAQGIDYDYIWIEFDLLRHQAVGTRFTREENIATWRKIGQIAETIIATPEGSAPPKLNPECIFCTVKTTCPLLTLSISTGGVHALTPGQQIDQRAKLDYQRKAVAAAITELDELILTRAESEDEMTYETDETRLNVVMRRTRTVEPETIEQIVGPDIFKFYGGKKLTMEQFNKMLKHPGLSEEVIAKLRSSIGTKLGEPSVKVEARGFTTD